MSLIINEEGWLEVRPPAHQPHADRPGADPAAKARATDPVTAQAQIQMPTRTTAFRLSPSPHVDERPENTAIELLVIHNISLPAGCFGGPFIEDLFLGRLDTQAHPSFAELVGVRVSSHFLIRRTGELVQFASTRARAWHAGVSVFDGRSRCNDFSIGVELEGCDTQAFEPAQMEQLAQLTKALVARHPTLRSVAGHADIAPDRKTDPGPFFSWADFHRRLREEKVSLHSPSEKPPVV